MNDESNDTARNSWPRKPRDPAMSRILRNSGAALMAATPPLTSSRPSAYAQYKKLVHDFDALECELQQHHEVQTRLESELRSNQQRVQDYEMRNRARELAEWAREREQRVEQICEQSSALHELQRQLAALDEEELRVTAELEVLKEKQQTASRSEAQRVFELVHERGSMLDRELAKGHMDLAFLTDIVSSARRHGPGQGDNLHERDSSAPELQVHDGGTSTEPTVKESTGLHALVSEVQRRRQLEFHAAAATFQERLRAFDREREELRLRAQHVVSTKQQALQILTSNQQGVIQGFFTTPREALQRNRDSAGTLSPTPRLPDLQFEDILQSLNQSGATVSGLQPSEHDKQVVHRQQLEGALEEARKNLTACPAKMEELQLRMQQRQQEARHLRVRASQKSEDIEAPESAVNDGYDGRWGVESYDKSQYPLVYFLREMIFRWMHAAIEMAKLKPNVSALQHALQNHEATWAVLEERDRCYRYERCASRVQQELVEDVIREMAASIHSEFAYLASQVRRLFSVAMTGRLFHTESAVDSEEKKSQSKKQSRSTDHGNKGRQPGSDSMGASTALRAEWFESAWEEIKRRRYGLARFANQDRPQPSPVLLLCPVVKSAAAAVVVKPSNVESIPSPKKKFFLFNSKPSTITPTPVQYSPSTIVDNKAPDAIIAPSPQNKERVVFTSSDAFIDTGTTESSMDTAYWARIKHEVITFSSLNTAAFPSCIQFSNDGFLLAVGTIEGELQVWDLRSIQGGAAVQGQPPPSAPTLIRTFNPAAKSPARCRITRLGWSANSLNLLAFNERRASSLWQIHPTTHTFSTGTHSGDCFQTDPSKYKPLQLTCTTELVARELFRELAAPPSSSSHRETNVPLGKQTLMVHPSSPELTSTAFFSSLSLSGQQHSVLCGGSNGDIVKFTIDKTEAAPQTSAMRKSTLSGILFGASEAVFTVPFDRDEKLHKPEDGSAGRCEAFREAHHSTILFLSTLPPRQDGIKSRLVSVDQDARVAIWHYDRERFTGFGWFAPVSTHHLDLDHTRDLSASSSSTDHEASASHRAGEILQIMLTVDQSRLVLMVFHKPSMERARGLLRFLQLDLNPSSAGVMENTKGIDRDDLALVPVRLELPFVGAVPPRFTLLAVKPQRAPLHQTQGNLCHVLVLLMDNTITFYSLTSGLPISSTSALALGHSTVDGARKKTNNSQQSTATTCGLITSTSHLQSSRQRGTTTPLPAVSVAPVVAQIAVAGEQHRQLRIYRLALSPATVKGK